MFERLKNAIFDMKHGYPLFYTVEELKRFEPSEDEEEEEETIFIDARHVPIRKIDDVKKDIFNKVVGYDNIKKILNSMLYNSEPVSILLDGPAGTGKSMMLKCINSAFQGESRYVDGSRMSKAGLFGLLKEYAENERTLKYLLIDELDKLGYDDQEALLTLIEDGRIVQTQKNGTFTIEFPELRVISASNDRDNINGALLTRFFSIHIKKYTNKQVEEITRRELTGYYLDKEIIEYIILRVLESKKVSKIRFAKQLAKLCNNSKSMVDILIENSTEDDEE